MGLKLDSLPIRVVLAKYKDGPQTGIFTDGCAVPNPGPGGWGYVQVEDGKVLTHEYGSDPETTNNRMELTGLIRAFNRAPAGQALTVYSDSELCVKTINEWAPSWEKRGWKKKTGPIKNLELVQELYRLHKEKPLLKLEWIKAHNGWLWNEYADSLASAWARDEL